jgi:hypothetical protein
MYSRTKPARSNRAPAAIAIFLAEFSANADRFGTAATTIEATKML